KVAEGGTIVATWQRVNARRRRGKGTATLMGAGYQAPPQGLVAMSVPQTQNDVFAGADASHPTQCNAKMGTEANNSVKTFMISSSLNGSASAPSAAQVVTPTAQGFTADRRIGLARPIDNAWLSNIYGNNPNTQGRNFVTCRDG